MHSSHRNSGMPCIGKMVDIGGYRLHVIDHGSGSPTVILDAGAGEFNMNWRSIQEIRLLLKESNIHD